MNTTKKTEAYQINTKNFLVDIDFNSNIKNTIISLKEKDGIGFYSIIAKNDEQISELYDIFKEIYKLNIGE